MHKKIHVCPKCGAKAFSVTAHVTQDWVVDENGDFIKCENDCVEVTHRPDDEDVWSCYNCDWSGAGQEAVV